MAPFENLRVSDEGTLIDFDIDSIYRDFTINFTEVARMTVRGQVRNAEALGRMLQQGRMLHGMSQRQLAEQLGIGQKWVWEMEQGKPGLLTERLFEMLRATGVRLYAEVDEPEEDAHPSELSSDE